MGGWWRNLLRSFGTLSHECSAAWLPILLLGAAMSGRQLCTKLGTTFPMSLCMCMAGACPPWTRLALRLPGAWTTPSPGVLEALRGGGAWVCPVLLPFQNLFLPASPVASMGSAALWMPLGCASLWRLWSGLGPTSWSTPGDEWAMSIALGDAGGHTGQVQTMGRDPGTRLGHMPVTPPLGRLRQEDSCKFKTSLSLRSA